MFYLPGWWPGHTSLKPILDSSADWARLELSTVHIVADVSWMLCDARTDFFAKDAQISHII